MLSNPSRISALRRSVSVTTPSPTSAMLDLSAEPHRGQNGKAKGSGHHADDLPR